MCPPETIPPLGHVNQLRARAMRQENEGRDIFIPTRNTLTNDEVVENENAIISAFTPRRHFSRMVNRGRVRMLYHLTEDYENLFRVFGLSRRIDRPVLQSMAQAHFRDQAAGIEMMSDWAKLCYANPDPQHDERVPAGIEHFPAINHHAMPPRLTIDG